MFQFRGLNDSKKDEKSHTRAACAVKKSRKRIKILKNKLRTSLSFGHFWTNSGYVSQMPVIRF